MKKNGIVLAIVLSIIISIIGIGEVNAAWIDPEDVTQSSGKFITHLREYGFFNGALYGKGLYPKDSSNPYPFNNRKTNSDGTYHPFDLFVVQDLTSNRCFGAYCVGYQIKLDTGDYPVAKDKDSIVSVHGRSFTDSEFRDIEYAMIFSYKSPASGEDTTPATVIWALDTEAHKTYSSQVLIWSASSGYLQDAAAMAKIETYLIEAYRSGSSTRPSGDSLSPDPTDTYYTLKRRLLNAMLKPSFVTDNVASASTLVLKWNTANARYEARVTDTNAMKALSNELNGESEMPNLNISYASNIGTINVDYDGNDVIFWTTERIGSQENPATITATKVINDGKGHAYLVQDAGNTIQPLAIYSDTPRDPEYGYIKFYTEGIKIKGTKTLIAVDGKYGDARVTGAVYGIYSNTACTDKVAEIVIKADGSSTKTDYLPYQTYYATELTAPAGTKKNSTVYTIDPSTAAVDADGDYSVSFSATNEIVTTTLNIVKYRNVFGTDESPAKGAILRLTLVSDNSETYTSVINAEGTCKFDNIPYGKYVVTEDKTADGFEYTDLNINPEIIDLYKSNVVHQYQLILSDEIIDSYIKIIKIDDVSGLPIKIAGAKFKIWDSANKEWVKLRTYPSGEYIEEFETNDEGYLITPEEIVAGKYVIYEIKAPTGYFINTKYRLPVLPSDLGDATKGGKEVTIDTRATNLQDDDTFLITIEMEDQVFKGKLDILKKGEVLTGVNNTSTKYDDNGLHTPVYEVKGLPNVEYTITAVNDIKSPDGSYTYVAAGTVVAKITTDSDGKATTGELYLGEYKIQETKTPLGYVTESNLENIIIKNNTTERVATTVKELTNKRQKVVLQFQKTFEEVMYSAVEKIEKTAVFGIFANEDIRNYKGEVVISRHDLVDLMRISGDGNVDSTIDLPAGNYYYRELEASYPYTVIEDEVEFTVSHSNTTNLNEIVYGEDVNNTLITTDLTLIKISTTSMADTVTTPIKDLEFDQVIIDQKVVEFLNTIKNMTIDQVKDYMEEQRIAAAKGAKYGIYMDEACTKPLYIKNSSTGKFEEATVIVNEYGMAILDNMPIGKYYIKELEAPTGYELSDKVGTIELTIANKDSIVYIALCDDEIKDLCISKTDIFTGEKVPNCVFEIADKETEEVVFKGKTNEDGDCYIPITIFKNGVEYTFTEIEAPDLYDMDLELNTEPHTFVASYDEDTFEWTGEELFAENYRHITDIELQKLDLADSTVIPNCEFELKSLETDFVVRGTTDENGIYIFKNIPYGEYTYTEISAPEEYMIDTEPHYLKVDANNIKIVVTNEKAPDTGDIAVYAIAGVAGICVLGLAYVFIKNKKKA